ncbi:ribosomal protection-like ABC-F family protein [Leuconostoc lactis]|uniref:ABC-F type ribosomal protection protein n=1 Tax=Leuconostoc lactis TaxID=1246 RepID=A0A6L7A9R7_LEULA|nr:ABC-F type ribosomal protection protein [Leuconostoc lactis]MWN20788.1 ABC-F type ribosomal protection protein [Leuconostoc lactis]
MTTIEIKHLTFGFDIQEKPLFDDINLNISSQWKLALIGRNGRGKTTLLNLLSEKYRYQGEINTSLKFNYFPQKISNKQQLTYTILQDLLESEYWKIERELKLLNISDEKLWIPFSELSGGEQTKILLALLFVDEQSFPLIDEPTNHLDNYSRQQVAHYLKEKKQGFILVSHDRNFINSVVDHVLSIEKEDILLYQGNFATYDDQKKKNDDFEQYQNNKLKKEIKRLKDVSTTVADWSQKRENETHDASSRRIAKKQSKRAKAIYKRSESKIKDKESLLKNIELIDTLSLAFTPTDKNLLIKVEDFYLSFERPIFNPINFELYKGEIMSIEGNNGSGKTSLINYILGHFSGTSTGNYYSHSDTTISYLGQSFEDNRGTLKEFAHNKGISYELLLNNLFKLGMERNVFLNRIENMSVGQKKRIALAKSLLTPAELFIWDEPLNYLDIFNQQQIEEVINQVKPTMIVVEHDKEFINKISKKNITLKGINF